ncbi:MAG: tetratricopeptide repeat protein, partial [Archangium sp.]|nr:tetratricopeptide repeat protein [Archangium sp.]
VLVTREATPRTEGMTATGGAPPMEEAPKEDTRLRGLFDAIEQHPDDADALANLALYLLRRQSFDEARPFIARATWLDPFHVRTRIARAVVKALDGAVPAAQGELERLGRRYPEGYDAHLFAGLLAMDQNDTPRALDAFDRYFAVAPPGEAPPMMKMAVEQLRRRTPPAP